MYHNYQLLLIDFKTSSGLIPCNQNTLRVISVTPTIRSILIRMEIEVHNFKKTKTFS
jgi:hypothetical protein